VTCDNLSIDISHGISYGPYQEVMPTSQLRGKIMTKQAELIAALESLVDSRGLYEVTEALELLCYEKAEHLLVNWQDKGAAKNWDRAAKVFLAARAKIEAIQLP
jgi:hypothetical protein